MMRWGQRFWRRKPPALYYVSDHSGWVLDREGDYLLQEAQALFPGLKTKSISETGKIRNALLHLSSLWHFLSHGITAHPSNHRVVTVFHGSESAEDEAVRAGVQRFKQHAQIPDRVITACGQMEVRLLDWGVPREKLHRIPLGVDLKMFGPVTPELRRQARRHLGIPEGVVCIGSFQKDGEGWEAGDEPKLIKGPDVLVETLRQLAPHAPLFVLLTGPARGFVKRGLEQAGIPYHHVLVKNFSEVPLYYYALDLYLVTAREEGGPKAFPECMAIGIPLVTTRVGMAPEMIENSRNGLVCEVGDVAGLVAACRQIIEQPSLSETLRQGGWQTASAYDWTEIARRYCREIYAPYLN